MVKRILWILLDVAVAALILLGVWVINFKIPQKGVRAVNMAEEDTAGNDSGSSGLQNFGKGGSSSGNRGTGNGSDAGNRGTGNGSDAGTGQDGTGTSGNVVNSDGTELTQTRKVLSTQDWHKKFADKFTDTVVSTDTLYTSPNLSIQISHHQYDSGTVDNTHGGSYAKYGSKISYVLADIYIGDITCFQTAFAQDTYGIGYTEKLTDMSARMKSILSVNGDSYSNNRHRENGTIIRNGVIYRSQQSGEETCVLNWDGTMDIYQPGQLDEQKLIGRGAYQSWIFGPSLLDANGKANDKFWTWTYIRRSHPRTAIGYFEPGHYCLLLVDGRQKSSRGMFLDEMAKVFENLGCKVAYNLDGGHCSFMEMNGKVVNDPYKPEHEIEDGIFITEGSL